MQDKLESTTTAATTAAPSGRGRRLNLRDRVVRPLVTGLAYMEATLTSQFLRGRHCRVSCLLLLLPLLFRALQAVSLVILLVLLPLFTTRCK